MSNFNLEPPVENIPHSACPLRAISELAVESATIEVNSMLRTLRDDAEQDLGEPVKPKLVADLDEKLLEQNGNVWTLVGEDHELYAKYQADYTEHLLDGFREARVKYAASVTE